jgi:hypothetical protein
MRILFSESGLSIRPGQQVVGRGEFAGKHILLGPRDVIELNEFRGNCWLNVRWGEYPYSLVIESINR